MDNPFLSQKSVSLIRCIKRIEEKRPVSAELLKDNFDLQDIISVHEYQSIDWEIVFDVIHNHLVNFKDFLRAVRDLN